ncbi:MAG: gene transfer agent family protein [Pseudomonadota bacterium]
MVNRHRGEIAAMLDGRQWTLCLTLGALAELESAFEATDLNQMTERFASGRLSANDMITVIGAGLRGAGHTLSNDEVREMQAEEGAVGYAKIVAELLSATFGSVDGDQRQ